MARAQCDNSTDLDLALFILTIISTHVTWWLLSLPTLYKHGFKTYMHDVAWECLRLHQPSFIAFRACFGEDRKYWQANYYSGVRRPTDNLKDLGKAVLKDGLIVVSTCLSLSKLANRGSNADLSGLNSSLWNYPSLPVAIYGLSITIFSKIPPTSRLRPWHMFFITTLVIIIIATAVALAMAYTVGRGIWIGCTILILFMALPLWGIHPKLGFMTAILAAVARTAGPIFGALSPNAYFPFCELRGWAFAGPLLAFTILALLMALYGIFQLPRQEEPDTPVYVEEMKEAP
ncbi:hypothetical protein CPB83DRAFT_894003 [Crepidotus variabilis]|uniref:Uncharacterized protein n=1 Tax=Crepidotus variabilis TaxID=179855 RepID=A0A9P6EHE7_9AGAR|nr:hypothetical protein CPB83DRAFT_894003 [Crepidotus variabilis]